MSTKNCVGVIVDEVMRGRVVKVARKSDKVIMVKIVLRKSKRRVLAGDR